MLFVSGGLDSQVPPGHAEYSARAVRALGQKAEVVIVPGVDHIFRPAFFG